MIPLEKGISQPKSIIFLVPHCVCIILLQNNKGKTDIGIVFCDYSNVFDSV